MLLVIRDCGIEAEVFSVVTMKCVWITISGYAFTFIAGAYFYLLVVDSYQHSRENMSEPNSGLARAKVLEEEQSNGNELKNIRRSPYRGIGCMKTFAEETDIDHRI